MVGQISLACRERHAESIARGVAVVMAAICVLSANATGAPRRAPIARHAAKTAAEKPLCPSSGGQSVSLSRIVDGSSFVTGEGTEVKLAGILAADTSGEVLSVSNVMAAKSALAGVLGGHAITLAPLGLPDRYGRVVAQVFADGEWVQGALLRLGLALANPATADAACAAALRVAEDAGHASRDGHWADGRFAVRSPDRLQSRAGTFQIVEGAVATAAIVNGRAYLDFGADRKHGFTVTVAPADMRAFRQAKIDLRQLAGKRVQVRGWIELFKGPEMQIVSPDAIKGLDKD